MKAAGTLLVALAVLLFCLARWFGVFDAKSPLPTEALDQLKTFVENDGRQVAAVNVFGMPGSGGPATAVPETVKVNRIRYLYPVPTHQTHGSIPAGTVVQLYRVEDTRVTPGGAEHFEERLFYVYRNAAGAWRFLENQKPDYDGTTTGAVPLPISNAVPAYISTCEMTPGEMLPPILG